MMNKNKHKINKSVIQMSNAIIRDREIGSVEFSLLLRLKYLIYENRGSGEIYIDIPKLRMKMEISDNRTLKKHLANLHKWGYINNFVKIERSTPSLISLDLKKFATPKKEYTQLPLSILSRVGTIGHTGVRLLYYFESYINRSIVQNQFCYSAVITICRDTGLGKTTVKEYVDILKKEKLLHVVAHKIGHNNQYNDNDELEFTKYNNHYYVNYNKLEEYELSV
ncbi:hypothetical protein [Paenibacillus donghaensis]|nr:hypothetical protein [Paenibacillus donghaensis]